MVHCLDDFKVKVYSMNTTFKLKKLNVEIVPLLYNFADFNNTRDFLKLTLSKVVLWQIILCKITQLKL